MSEGLLEKEKPGIIFNLIRVIPIVILIGTAGGGWAVNTWRDEQQDKSIEKLKTNDEKLLDATARFDERQKSIQDDVRFIKRYIERQRK